MLFTDSELDDCMLFKGLAHAYFQSLLLDDKKRCNAYYFKYEV